MCRCKCDIPIVDGNTRGTNIKNEGIGTTITSTLLSLVYLLE
jgi:hypothetical protein